MPLSVARVFVCFTLACGDAPPKSRSQTQHGPAESRIRFLTNMFFASHSWISSEQKLQNYRNTPTHFHLQLWLLVRHGVQRRFEHYVFRGYACLCEGGKAGKVAIVMTHESDLASLDFAGFRHTSRPSTRGMGCDAILKSNC